MDTFLKSIASVYLEKHAQELKNYCFIFPNRRSSIFFKKYLADLNSTVLIYPKISTISDFITEVSGVIIPSNLELIMSLYDEYQKILKNKEVENDDFDKFIFWGNMILNDFNDVDRYLIDAERIFLNIKDYKSINSNYLTEEQKKILAILGFKNSFISNQDENFWNNCSDIKKSFINIWEILYPLYLNFNARLSKEHKAYTGSSYKLALKNLQQESPENLPYTKYIFIGFNMLSKSEECIFKYFKDNNIGDFYWDYDNIFFKNQANKGLKFIKKYVQEFPSKYEIPTINKYPNTKILSVPSNSLQAKETNEIIKSLISKNKVSSINTAIVIPDEELFIPVLSNISEGETEVNITYGFPMKYASISSLISALTQLQNRARKEIGTWTFFHEDVKNILSHPYLKNFKPIEIKSFLKLITDQKLYRVSTKDIDEHLPVLSSLFRPLTDLDDRNMIFDYLQGIISFTQNIISNNKIEKSLADFYQKSLEELKSITNNYQFKIKGNTYLYLIENLISSQTVQFEGEPLKGLQIMGVLETRCLDFENVIILSMNEKVFPKKHFQKSFIPNNLRKAYKLSTLDHQESIFAYYFYRLISKADNVYLIYDSRTQGISSGEPSRYIYQLKYLYNSKINLSFNSFNFNIKSPDIKGISIKKDNLIMQKLSEFKGTTDNIEDKKYLSASSIFKYIRCPLSFYLDKIENINIEQKRSDFIESSIFGNIIHNILRDIYTEKSIINNFQLEKIITSNINKYYLNKGQEESSDSLEGEALLISDVVKYYIDNILNYDNYKINGIFIKSKSELPFEIIQCEKEEKGIWDINEAGKEKDDNLIINFKQFIDRVDTIPGQGITRIIDYKTGSDENKIASVSSLFDRQSDKNIKGVFQLFIYNNFYSHINNYSGPVKPLLYKIKEIRNQKKNFNIQIDKQIIEDLNDPNVTYNKDFMTELRKIILELFNPEIPFKQTENKKNCEFCNFKIICQR